jgi:hypothetical protein
MRVWHLLGNDRHVGGYSHEVAVVVDVVLELDEERRPTNGWHGMGVGEYPGCRLLEVDRFEEHGVCAAGALLGACHQSPIARMGVVGHPCLGTDQTLGGRSRDSDRTTICADGPRVGWASGFLVHQRLVELESTIEYADDVASERMLGIGHDSEMLLTSELRPVVLGRIGHEELDTHTHTHTHTHIHRERERECRYITIE